MYNLIILNKNGKNYSYFQHANNRWDLNEMYEKANKYMNQHLDEYADVFVERDFSDEKQIKSFDELKKSNRKFKDDIEVSLEELCAI